MAIIRNSYREAGHYFIFTDRMILVKKETLELATRDVFEALKNTNSIKQWIYEDEFDYVSCFLEDEKNIPEGFELTLVVHVFALYNNFSSLAARARSLALWTKSMNYCSTCGGKLIDSEDETAVDCSICSIRRYPSFSPAIIVLIKKDDKILLAKHAHRATTVYTCLAGYVEQGETLEECVAREVFEEVSLKVKNIKYIKSQAWPFPNQLMFGYTCDWEAGEIDIDTEELAEANWYTRDSLPSIPNHGTIARYLIDGCY